jgi:uncharacterized protein
MSMQAQLLPDGKRLHLHHGPIDLIILAEGESAHVKRAYHQATTYFSAVLPTLVDELDLLRQEIPKTGLGLRGLVARRMEQAVQPHWTYCITPMAAVAGAVAENMLAQICAGTSLRRAYVNNGGDIALHLRPGTSFSIASPSGPIDISSDSPVRGVATSGWRGRSFSLGIADSVTVLAERAADADVAATLIANEVDLPLSPLVKRQKANEIAPDSDLRDRLVTVDVSPLREALKSEALNRGQSLAEQLLHQGHILGASLLLQGQKRNVSQNLFLEYRRHA